MTRDGQTCPIESPVRESKSNGAMERADRIWQGLNADDAELLRDEDAEEATGEPRPDELDGALGRGHDEQVSCPT